MKYPKDNGPQSITEMYALLFGMLGSAYNIIDQYEKDEAEREKQHMMDMFDAGKNGDHA